MIRVTSRYGIRALAALCSATFLTGCGESSPVSPTSPDSFLAGTWRGTLTVTRRGQPDVTGTTTWAFELVPQTNRQTFRAIIRSENPWLPLTTTATAALIPSADPPAQISTQGDYASPRGCRGDFGSFGVAEARTIDASFDGVDCDLQTFTGRLLLTKQ